MESFQASENDEPHDGRPHHEIFEGRLSFKIIRELGFQIVIDPEAG